MNAKRIVIGSRSSKLAMAQTQHVRDKLKKFYPAWDFEIKTIKTLGDKILDVALSKIGDKGLFTKEIEEALLRGEIDLAVHSMKDLPTQLSKSLKIAAVTKREDPRDILVSKQGFTPLEKADGEQSSLTGFTLKTLPQGAKVGTSSLRRRAQLLSFRSDLMVTDLRGNLDTRIKKLEQGLYDGIIVAYAGVKRLGLKSKIAIVPLGDILPQAGQGALGIEIREGAAEVNDLVKVLDDFDSRLCVNAERALLSGLEGGCQIPIGVYAQIQNSRISIKAGVFSLDGKQAVRDEIAGPKDDAETLGRQLADRFLEKRVVREILDEVRKAC